MTKSFNCKALRAFRKLGAVALITATLSIFFAACNQTGNTGGGGGIDDGKPKHAITFKVDGSNGTLKAIVVDKEINSEDKVEQGKTVTFLATPDGDYRVESGWCSCCRQHINNIYPHSSKSGNSYGEF